MHDASYYWFDATGSGGGVIYWWRLLTQVYNSMTVEFLDTVKPNPGEMTDRSG
eukprot:COSAG02_NODE_24435_length_688_cov_0.943973_1_plen_52_part_10